MNSTIFQRIAVSLGCVAVMGMPIVGVSSSWQTAQASDQSTLSEFPGRRVGGGSRGECMSDDTLVALSPKNHLIETTKATPTLYFAMPEFEYPLQVEFILKNVEGEIIADQLFEAESNGGVTGLDLTNQIEPLEVGQDYEWYLSVLCNANNRAYDMVVHGWMRRVPGVEEDNVVSDIQLTEQVQSYQAQGLWHNAIALLLQFQQDHNSDIHSTNLWAALLEAEGLQELINVDIQPNL